MQQYLRKYISVGGMTGTTQATARSFALFRLRVVKVAPQSLKKTLGGATDQKWRDRAAELFNPDSKRRNWSKGAAGAVSVAFKVAGD